MIGMWVHSVCMCVHYKIGTTVTASPVSSTAETLSVEMKESFGSYSWLRRHCDTGFATESNKHADNCSALKFKFWGQVCLHLS